MKSYNTTLVRTQGATGFQLQSSSDASLRTPVIPFDGPVMAMTGNFVFYNLNNHILSNVPDGFILLGYKGGSRVGVTVYPEDVYQYSEDSDSVSLADDPELSVGIAAMHCYQAGPGDPDAATEAALLQANWPSSRIMFSNAALAVVIGSGAVQARAGWTVHSAEHYVAPVMDTATDSSSPLLWFGCAAAGLLAVTSRKQPKKGSA